MWLLGTNSCLGVGPFGQGTNDGMGNCLMVVGVRGGDLQVVERNIDGQLCASQRHARHQLWVLIWRNTVGSDVVLSLPSIRCKHSKPENTQEQKPMCGQPKVE